MHFRWFNSITLAKFLASQTLNIRV